MIIYWLKYKGTVFPVAPSDCLLGRNPECLIVLASERVSREHAVVRRTPAGIEIEDLQSRNGTWVNDRLIERPTALQNGDRVIIGEDLLEVVVKPNARAPITVAGVLSPFRENSQSSEKH